MGGEGDRIVLLKEKKEESCRNRKKNYFYFDNEMLDRMEIFF